MPSTPRIQQHSLPRTVSPSHSSCCRWESGTSATHASCVFVCDPSTLWSVACQVSLSLQFSRQGYWSGLAFPPPGDQAEGSNICILCIGRWILCHCATWEAYASYPSLIYWGKLLSCRGLPTTLQEYHRLHGHELEQAGSWWWTGKPDVLQSRVRHDWETEHVYAHFPHKEFNLKWQSFKRVILI